MSGFETTVAWLTIQISIALVPATFLHLWASRRDPAQGAWVAVASLALVLALLPASFCPMPRIRSFDHRPASAMAASHEDTIGRVAVSAAGESSRLDRPDSTRRGITLSNVGLIEWIERIQRSTNRSASQHSSFARVLISLIVAGVALGLIRLIVGLWGIRLCRRRGMPIENPDLMRITESLRVEMGCRKPVELREVPDLGTAATAGWRRPLILLPEDWQTWDAGERRAVLAHELAHVIRADYAAGLLARLTLALHFYHPLVRWMTGRLLAQQELAADALGARFAGGKDSYVLALSRLALRQDQRASFWPARTFLPAKGTLIRRIEMLTNMEVNADRSFSRWNRILAACLLLAVGAGVLAMPRPSLGGDEPAPKVALKEAVAVGKQRDLKPTPAIDLSYLPADARGFWALQPAAICRQERMSALVAEMNSNLASRELFWLAMMEFGWIPMVADISSAEEPRSNCPFHIEEIEQLTSNFHIDRTVQKGVTLRRMNSVNHMIRMVEPFNWEKQARAWWPKMSPVQDLRLVYYKINSPHYVGRMCVFFPDNRTIVIDSEENVREFINREKPTPPQFVQRLDWGQIQRNLFVMAIDNHDHRMAAILKKESGKDAVDISRLFEDADLWAFHLVESDRFNLMGFATCASKEMSRPLAIKSGMTLVEMKELTGELSAITGTSAHVQGSEVQKLFAKILAGYEVIPSRTTVNLISKPAVKLADFFGVIGRRFADETSHEGSKPK